MMDVGLGLKAEAGSFGDEVAIHARRACSLAKHWLHLQMTGVALDLGNHY